MDISDADMIMAADRGERLYRARRAQALLRERARLGRQCRVSRLG